MVCCSVPNNVIKMEKNRVFLCKNKHCRLTYLQAQPKFSIIENIKTIKKRIENRLKKKKNHFRLLTLGGWRSDVAEKRDNTMIS